MEAIFKFNSGMGALLCSNCRIIIKTGIDFTEDEWKAIRGEIDMNAQYCNKCKEENHEHKEDNSEMA